MSSRFRLAHLAGAVFICVYGAAIWGPPRLRFDRGFDLESLDEVAGSLSFESGFTFDTANLIHLGTWAALGSVVFLMFTYRSRPFLQTLLKSPISWYSLYALWAILSAVYSPSAAYTLFFAAKIPILLLATIVVVKVFHVNAPLRVMFAIYIGQWVAIVILYFLRPELVGVTTSSSGYRLHGGIFLDYGMSAAVAGIYFLTLALESHGRKVYWVLYILTWIFVILSQTRFTMIASIAVGAYIIVSMGRRVTRFNIVVFVGCAIGCALLLGLGDSIVEFVRRGQSVNELRSLSDRSLAFEYLISAWSDSPIVGYGYASGTRELMVGFFNETGMPLGAAHDVLSKVLADLGIIGALLLGISILSVVYTLLAAWRHMAVAEAWRRELVWITALVLYLGITSITDESVASGPPIFIVSIVVLERILNLPRSVERQGTCSV